MKRSPITRKRVLIPGGGFAGRAAALEPRPDRYQTLIDRSCWFELLPNIHELLWGVKTPELLCLPDRVDLRNRIAHESVTRITHPLRRRCVATVRPSTAASRVAVKEPGHEGRVVARPYGFADGLEAARS
jgi:hypothetical protein